MQRKLSLAEYGIVLARAAAQRSEDPYHRVGAALIRYDKTVAAVGYNGPPSGVNINWSQRDARRPYVVHAEANALRYVKPGEVHFMATTMMPCSTCLLAAKSYGIDLIVYADDLDPSVYPVADILRVAKDIGVILDKLELRVAVKEAQ